MAVEDVDMHIGRIKLFADCGRECRDRGRILPHPQITVTAAELEVDIRREGIAGVIREMVAPRNLEAAE